MTLGIDPPVARRALRIGIAAPADLGLLAPFFPGLSLPSGLGSTVVAGLVKGFLAEGYSIVLYTLDETVDRPMRFDAGALTIHVGPYRSRHRMRDLMAAERRAVRDMILSDPPDLLNAHWCYEFALGALATRLPALITVCDWAPTILRLRPDLYRLGRLGMFFWTLARARHFAAPSAHIADLVKAFTRRDCTLVGQPLEDRLFRPAPRLWPGGTPSLISVANGWGRLKNTRTLIQAFAGLRRCMPAAQLTFYGHDHGPGELAEQWARARGLADGIQFAGFLPNRMLLEALGRAHLYVHPSLEESFGQVVLEAMAAGTPVIGGHRSGAVPWLLEAGRAGLLVDPLDAAALCQAMERMLSDPARWEAFSAAGLASARQRFTAQAVAARYRDLFQALLPPHR